MMRVRQSTLVWAVLSTAAFAKGFINCVVKQEWASNRKFERNDANFDVLITDQQFKLGGCDLRQEHNMTWLSKVLDQSLFILNVKKLHLSLIIRTELGFFKIAKAVVDV